MIRILKNLKHRGEEGPAAVELSTVVSEALPGQIKLTWKAPEGDYAYMQIRYYDPLTKEKYL